MEEEAALIGGGPGRDERKEETPEVVSVAGGGLKNVSVSDKLANGFKVEFYGSATSVTLKLHVKGGFYSG